jgi:hypothetical protein
VVKQVSGSIFSAGLRIHNQARFLVIQRPEINSVLFGVAAGVVGGEKKKVLAVRQNGQR